MDCQGFNGTIFAYGQTGAGKSFTMEGAPDPPELQGIIPNSFKHIFDAICVTDKKQFLVRASYLEIYNEEIRDLLSKDPKNRLELKENVDSGVYVKDLTSFVVKSSAEIDHVMTAGKKNRSVGATLMNATSSRSHSIFTVTVETAEFADDGEAHIRVGKLNMVDLAGSERQSKTGATGARLKEATKINLSLSALGNVISALVDGKTSYVPYRDSKLTRLLQDSLGGNTKTVMCANCGPADYNYDETVSTLRYASRAKNIKNKPRINEDPKDAMLREFQDEIERLKRQLAEAGAAGGAGGAGGPGGERVVEKVVEKVIVKEGLSEEKMKELEDKMASEKEELQKRADAERAALLSAKASTEEEKAKLAAELRAREVEREKAEAEKTALNAKLKAMQEKLIMGGEVLSKAQRQEAELRAAEAKLEREKEEARRKELEHKQELEEANIMMEEQYASMAEEVEAKTKKLKKCWSKLQAAKQEIADLQHEFQSEREDMLDTIREINRELKLKNLIIEHFVPPTEASAIQARATFDEEKNEWKIARLEFAGNNVNSRRPISSTGRRRPESEYARHRQSYDPNPRYKADNVGTLDLEMPERTTQDYEESHMSQRVAAAINAALVGDEEEVMMAAPENLPSFNPYLSYSGDDPEGRREDDDRRRSKKGRKRPGTARRKRSVEEEDPPMRRDDYPEARGLVGRR